MDEKLENVRCALYRKLDFLSQRLESEQDLSQIDKIFGLIERGHNVLKKIQ